MSRYFFFPLVFLLFFISSCRRDLNRDESFHELPKEDTLYVFPFQTHVDTKNLSCGYKKREHWSDEVKIYVKGQVGEVSVMAQKDIGQEIHDEHITMLLYNSREMKRRVQKIIRKMKPFLENKEFSYTSYIVESTAFNAFTIPGGNIYVTTGLLEKVESDDVLAYIIGHELGHNENGHTREGARFYEYVHQQINDIEEAESVLGQLWEGLEALVSVGGLKVASDYFDQSDELEADITGLYLAYCAGFDPEKALEGLELLKTIDVPKPDEDWKELLLSFFRTHPWSEDRLRCGSDYVDVAKVVIKCDSVYNKGTKAKINIDDTEVPVFEYPHTSAKQLMPVTRGSNIHVICDCVKQPSSNEVWTFVRSTRGGREGWIRRDFLEIK